MITEISFGSSGIKEYLENGQKKDRYFSRDELDERIPLDGDLEFVDDVISSMDDNIKDKFFHITFSFKEDEIDRLIMDDLVRSFKQYFFAGYNENELTCYAEAHNPRIKSYLDKNGNTIERKPHIHMIIPKINLITGEKFDRYIKTYIPYNDAWQEHFNDKHGLESPKDNRRYTINDNSEFISRYKGDGFKGANKDFKVSLLNDILTNNISSLEELKQYLVNNNHTILLRNKNKPLSEQYLNIQHHDGNINLRDMVFRDDFLKLSTQDKIQKISNNHEQQKNDKQLILQKQKRDDNPENLAIMHNWINYKADENRYMINLSSNQRTKFNNLSDDEKKLVIQKNKTKNQITIKVGVSNGKFSQSEYTRVINSALNATKHNITILEHNISRRSRIEGIDDTVRTNGWRAIIKGRFERSSRESWRGERGYGGSNNVNITTKINPESNLISSIKYQSNKKPDNKPLDFKNHISTLNKSIKSDVLLEFLEKSHGINPELYRVTVAKDGTDRIGVGTRNLNNFDFLVKHVNLPVGQSIKILEACLNMQQDINRKKAYQNTDGKYLYSEYQQWLNSYKEERTTLLTENKTNLDKLKTQINNKYQQQISAAFKDKTLAFDARKVKVDALKFAKSAELQNIKKIGYTLTHETRQQYNLEMQSSYRVFLLRKAQEDDEQALRELRRLRIDYQALNTHLTFNYVERYQEFKLDITHVIDKNGIVHYKLDNKTIMKDHGSKVELNKINNDTLALSFNLARKKFGDKINLTGTDEFRTKCVNYALLNGLRVTFTDEFSNNYYQKIISKCTDTSNKLADSATLIIQNKPSKLIVDNFYDEKIMINNKLSDIKVISLRDIDTGKIYNLHNPKLAFASQNFEVGDFVNVSLDNQTNEIYLKTANDNKIKQAIQKDIINQRNSEFINDICKKYNVDKPLNTVTGKVIKMNIKNSVIQSILIKSNTDIMRINKQDIINQLVNAKVGDSVSIVTPKEIDVTKTKVIKVTEVKKTESKSVKLKQYKNTEQSIIAQVLTQHLITLANGKLVTRINIKNLDSGKLESIFSNEKLHCSNNEFYCLDKVAFNTYKITNLDDSVKSIANSLNTPNLVTGEVKSFGETLIRGKNVWHVEIATATGVVKKYGDKLKDSIIANNINVNDTISIEQKDANHNFVVKQKVMVVKNLSIDIQNAVVNKINTEISL